MTATKKRRTPVNDLEFRIELLKERIYATLALLAVLWTIDPGHTSAAKAAGLIGGTALSLWVASIVAAQMSYRIVTQQLQTDRRKADRQFAQHAQLLSAAVFPLFLVGLAYIHVISLSLAIDLAIGASMLLFIGWSLLSAKALHTKRLNTLIIAGIELAVGLAIVWLKLTIGH